MKRGLKSFGGYVLGHSVENLFDVPAYPREVRIAQQGSLLSLSGAKTLTVLTRDVPAIRVEVGRLLPQQIQYLVSQTDGAFTQPTFDNWRFDAANITERFAKTIRLPKLKAGAPHYEPVALAEYLADDAREPRGIFFVRVEAWDAEHDRPLSGDERTDWNSAQYKDSCGRAPHRAHRSRAGRQALARWLAGPVRAVDPHRRAAGGRAHRDSGAQRPARARCDDGRAKAMRDLPICAASSASRSPCCIWRAAAGDLAFLPVQDRDRRLDLSRFEVGGVDNRVDQGTLSAYLFSDRGLYRPGEEIRIGAIVRSQDWKRSTQDVPLRLEVQDPRGITVAQRDVHARAGRLRRDPATHARDVGRRQLHRSRCPSCAIAAVRT